MMNHVEVKELIEKLYKLYDEWQSPSYYGITTYYFAFMVGYKPYVVSVYEEKNRAKYYIIEDETKYISATTKSKTFEQDLRELSK